MTTTINPILTQTAESQTKLSPAMSLDLLAEGNMRFVAGTTLQRDSIRQVKETTKGQYPYAAILSCIDSRVPVETVFDLGIGDIFSVRIAGNFVNRDILGSLEFACKLAGSKLIVIMGHTSCGAVKGACDMAELGNLTQMLGKIAPALDHVETEPSEVRDSSNFDFVNNVARKNVELSIASIKDGSPVLNEMCEKGEIAIVGAMYDVATGAVKFLEGNSEAPLTV